MTDPAARNRSLARECACVLRDVFDEYHEAFRAAARRSARHFRARDWFAVRTEATDRLRLYARNVDHAIAQVNRRSRREHVDRSLWMAMRDEYAALIEGRADREIAETFFSSVTRRFWQTTGVDRDIEFQRAWSPELIASADDAARRWCSGADGIEVLARRVLAEIGHALADPDGEVSRVGNAIAQAAQNGFGDSIVDGAEILTSDHEYGAPVHHFETAR